MADRLRRAGPRRAVVTASALAGCVILVIAAVGAARIGFALGRGSRTTGVSVNAQDESALLFWTPQRMRGAAVADGGDVTPTPDTPTPTATRTGAADGGAGATGFDNPPPVEVAVAEARPYALRPVRIEGRVFAKSGPTTTVSCSGTVVRSPGHDMVWTAAHCVDGGRGWSLYSDIVFVPAYDSGGGHDAAALAPLGVWTVRSVLLSPEWVANGDPEHSKADYAALVVAPRSDGARLADVVQAAAPILFDAPRGLPISAYGYPAEPPYSGDDLYRCDSPSAVYSEFDEAGPNLVWIGCTMTPGSSGGGWFATVGGTAYLVSNFSMYSADARHYGPYLSTDAHAVYDAAVAQGG